MTLVNSSGDPESGQLGSFRFQMLPFQLTNGVPESRPAAFPFGQWRLNTLHSKSVRSYRLILGMNQR